MNKLTREQADWLIEKLKCVPYAYIHAIPEWSNMLIEAKIVINQCTEKHFPGFYANDISDVHFLTISSGAPINSNWAYISSGGGHMNKEQFNQFTKNCQKICEWLQSQNE